MTQAPTELVVSAIIDNEMRYAYTSEERVELVGAIVDEPHPEFSSKVYVWDRPCRESEDGAVREFPGTQLRVATDPAAGYGALNWASREHRELLESFTDSPPDEPPSIRFDTQSDYFFPADALLPLDAIRQAVSEFISSGLRPRSVEWQDGYQV
ncbi:Imm1 family immunity protein [Saccharopolyspora hirsuta]|nr:Imm1 family immunity protein [Saccharopolyspora hirsuta]